MLVQPKRRKKKKREKKPKKTPKNKTPHAITPMFMPSTCILIKQLILYKSRSCVIAMFHRWHGLSVNEWGPTYTGMVQYSYPDPFKLVVVYGQASGSSCIWLYFSLFSNPNSLHTSLFMLWQMNRQPEQSNLLCWRPVPTTVPSPYTRTRLLIRAHCLHAYPRQMKLLSPLIASFRGLSVLSCGQSDKSN